METSNLSYDKSDPKSIESYAKKLIGKTFYDVAKENDPSVLKESFSLTYGDSLRKGGLGNFIEKYYFGYEPNSDPRPDFPDAGVELKVTPYEKRSNNKLSAGERLVLTMINFGEEVQPDLKRSHLWQKCELMLLIFYLRDRTKLYNFDYQIDYASLFKIPEEDLLIILNDYKIIIEKIRAGKAHELSESDTMYLGACTKGSTAARSWVSQYYNPTQKAKKRAFCFKTSYMTYILNNYIVPGKVTYGESIASSEDLTNNSFADILQQKLSQYIGMYEDDIAFDLGMSVNKNDKSYEASIVYKMLGVKHAHVEEFEKAGITVRIIKYRAEKSKNQQFRLDDINFIELDKEKMDDEILDEENNPIGWEFSELYNILSNRKYLFAIFWEDENGSVFKGSQLWGMPDGDIEVVRDAWRRTKSIVREGIDFAIEYSGRKKVVTNNLPGMSDNGIFHIRPHASKTYYEFLDGTRLGSGSVSDSVQLPNGERMTRQSYWLNRAYVDSQIKSDLRRKYK